MEEKEIIKVTDTEYNIVITPVVEPTIINRSMEIVNDEIEKKHNEILEVETFLETKRLELQALIDEKEEAIAKGIVE